MLTDPSPRTPCNCGPENRVGGNPFDGKSGECQIHPHGASVTPPWILAAAKEIAEGEEIYARCLDAGADWESRKPVADLVAAIIAKHFGAGK
jgi:hypothetical protein